MNEIAKKEHIKKVSEMCYICHFFGCSTLIINAY